MMVLPRLYAILDAGCFGEPQALIEAVGELAKAGVTLLQYRNKSAAAPELLDEARAIRQLIMHSGASPRRTGEGARPHTAGSEFGREAKTTMIQLIMNDRADLALAAEFDGVHVGQDDLSPESVRKIIGPERWLGGSTHNPQQVIEADKTSADYIAIGPVFTTASKANPDPVIGLEGVRHARALTKKPLVAIGGINRQNCHSVIEAGADSVAVISDLVRQPGKSAEEFLRILG